MEIKDKFNNKKFDKLIHDAVKKCHFNLKELIDTEQVIFWAERLGVSKSLISSRWKKDHFPNIPNIIKLLIISGYSANWLLLGIGPKYIKQVHNPDQVAADESRRREITTDLFQLEKQLEEKTEQLNEIRRLIEKNSTSSAFANEIMEKNLFYKSPDEIRSSSGRSLFKHNLLPLMTLMQFVNQVCFKLFETLSGSSDGADIIESLLKYIRENTEKNQFALLSSLSDLDRMIDETGLAKFLKDTPAK